MQVQSWPGVLATVSRILSRDHSCNCFDQTRFEASETTRTFSHDCTMQTKNKENIRLHLKHNKCKRDNTSIYQFDDKKLHRHPSEACLTNRHPKYGK